MEEGAIREAEKGRKTALKGTRRLARVLGVKFNEGEDSDESAQRDADPFPGFPSRKAARKLSSNERELLVRLLGVRNRGQRWRDGGILCSSVAFALRCLVESTNLALSHAAARPGASSWQNTGG